LRATRLEGRLRTGEKERRANTVDTYGLMTLNPKALTPEESFYVALTLFGTIAILIVICVMHVFVSREAERIERKKDQSKNKISGGDL